MPLKTTIAARKITHSKQVRDGATEWLCIQCNYNFPSDQFLTKRNGYRMTCSTCSKKSADANLKYRQTHAKVVSDNSLYYENIRKERRKQIIETHNKMISDGCDVIICTKCKKNKPIESFKNHTRSITKHCYECRQYQNIIESSRPPDTRVRNIRTKKHSDTHYYCRKYCAYKKTDITKGFYKDSIEFERMLPRQYAYSLMNLPCTYCGFFEHSKIGLDRVDPTKPHSTDNVLSCCEPCNIDKGLMSIQTFSKHITSIEKQVRFWRSPSGIMECPF